MSQEAVSQVIIINIFALYMITMLNVVYFCKPRIIKVENRIFSKILLTSLIISISGLVFGIIATYYHNVGLVSLLFGKIYTCSLLLWICLFTYYSYVISVNKNMDNSKIDNYLIYLCILFLLIPMNLKTDNYSISVEGLLIQITYIIYSIGLIMQIVLITFNIKNIMKKKYIPIISVIIFSILFFIVQVSNPNLNYLNSLMSIIVSYLMYFTIENPDVKMMNELELAKDHAEKANRAKTDFLSSMSHEIRTPLNAVVGFSESIKNDKTIEQAQKDADDIISASHSLLEIVNGVLDISKIEAGKMDIIETSYHPYQVFSELVTLISPRIGEKPVVLKTHFAEDIPNTLKGDVGKLKEIIMNLLTNAVKYTDKGEVDFNVDCVNSNNVSKLVISVEDTGRGIKQEKIDKLFTKFNRLDEDKNTTLEGTGLGLAITKSLVDMLGGKIVVQSVYGSGSKFTVYLAQNISNEKDIEEKPIRTNGNVDFTNKKILVVDDNKLNLKVANRLLTDLKITTVDALSGDECIDKINNDKFDLILMDDMMPKKSGTETLNEIKADNLYNGPIVVLTANAVAGEREKYLKLGFDEYLAKPIDKNELKRVLALCLSSEKVYSPLDDAPIVVVDGKTSEIDPEIIAKMNEDIPETEVITNEKKEEEKIVIEQTKEEQKTYDTKILKDAKVDLKHGLDLLGDMDMYNETLETFLEESKTRVPKIKELLDKKDMPNYAIEVHAQKSDCKYLGFIHLADLSYDHELKSKANDYEYVKKHFDELMKETNKMLEVTKTYLNK
jgi:signal transduction histidine kinase/CheY-like chemotaxis protein/HPt (histidine-containing phosphotransfer) domain-containing protein